MKSTMEFCIGVKETSFLVFPLWQQAEQNTELRTSELDVKLCLWALRDVITCVPKNSFMIKCDQMRNWVYYLMCACVSVCVRVLLMFEHQET